MTGNLIFPILALGMRTKDVLSPKQVAEIFGVDAGTVSEWAERGRLAYFRTPGGHRRFRRDAVDALLATLDPAPTGDVA